MTISEEQSKIRLKRIMKKRLQTTMIGALDALEKKIGFLWGHNSNDNLTEEQKEFRRVYEELRSEILDNGNNQIRLMESELNDFEVKWLRYHINLPIRKY